MNVLVKNKKVPIKNLFIIIFFIFFSLNNNLNAFLKFIGPNPYFSFQTFPQDVISFKKGTSIFHLSYIKRGWMGNLDHPEASPSSRYVDTEGRIIETDSNYNRLESGFKGVWGNFEIITIPYVFNKADIFIMPLIKARPQNFMLNSSGIAFADHDGVESTIPFSSSLSQNSLDISVGFIIAKKLKKMDLGLEVTYKRSAESSPKGSLTYEYNGSTYNLNRFNWGWSVVSGCNHIFGPSTNIDAFWLDYYSDVKRTQIDISLGANYNDNKSAIHYRKITGIVKYFEYEKERDQYEEEKWREKTDKTMIRLIDVFKITKIGKATLFCTGLIEFDSEKSPIIYEGVELEDYYKDKIYGIEILPFLHFDLPYKGFLRIGTSVSFFKSNYSYSEVWGSQKVYSSGWTYYGWEKSWERSSYGNSFTFTNFSEMDSEIVLNNKTGLKLISQVWSHLTYKTTNRYYGRNKSDDNGVYNLVESAKRKSFKKELWIGGSIGIQRGKKNIIGIFVDLPIHYDLYSSTEVEGTDGEYFKGTSNIVPTIRRPFVLRAMFVYNW